MTTPSVAPGAVQFSRSVEEVILALNAAEEQQTSFLDRDGLRRLVAKCIHLGLSGDAGRDGFLIALNEASDYDSPNFLWFKARFEHFYYIDRIIVSPTRRGKGVGRALYQGLFRRAIERGVELIGCEVNLQPPNPASDNFHEALGFQEVGRATFPDSTKIVRYLALLLT